MDRLRTFVNPLYRLAILGGDRMRWLFSPSGREGRLGFLVRQLLLFAAAVVAFSCSDQLPTLASILIWVPGVFLFAWLPWAGVIKRLHDLNRPAQDVAKIVIPISNAAFMWELFTRQGDANSNQYGPPPRLWRTKASPA